MTCQHEWTGKQVSRVSELGAATTCRICGMSEDMWSYLRPNGLAELQAEIELLREAVSGVAILLNTELKEYTDEPWAARVMACSQMSDKRETD